VIRHFLLLIAVESYADISLYKKSNCVNER